MRVFSKVRVTSPVFALSRLHENYSRNPKACYMLVWWVLLQPQKDKIFKSVNYSSRLMYDADTWCVATQWKFHAIVWAPSFLRQYWEETHFIIKTDHQTISWISNLKESSRRPVCWTLWLVSFDYEITVRLELYHLMTNAMSQLRATRN